MQKLTKSFLCITLLFAAMSIKADSDCCDNNNNNDCSDRCVSIFIPRSGGDNLVRNANYHGYQYGNDCFYGEFSLEYRFQRNFREERVARSLFGSSCLSFVGSNVSGRDNAKDLIADNFGLSPDLNTKLGFCPRIDNHIVDFQLYVGLNELWEGLYLQLNAPLQHSKWKLRPGSCTTDSNCCDNNNNGCDNGDCNGSNAPALSSTTGFQPGCMDAVSAGTIAAATSFEQALGGDFTFGDMQEKWKYGRFNFCEQDDTKLADFYINLGYNFYECPDYHFGAFIRVVAPTGTETNEDCAVNNVFYPIIGQDHWRLGAGISAHAELWNCDDEHFVNVYFEGYLVHMFDRCQLRSFDFKDKGCMSRYMLLKEFNADNSYKGLINAINFTTRHVEVDVDVQGEAIIEFVYSNDCGFSAGIGYNIYGRSEDNICNIGSSCDAAIDSRKFGFKGCSSVEVSRINTDGAGPNTNISDPRVIAGVASIATRSNAKITDCGTTDNAVAFADNQGGNNITVESCPALPAAGSAVTATTPTRALNSTTSVFVTKDDLDLKSGAVASQVSHKIFGHLDYKWSDCDWTPFLRAGAEVEFASCEDVGTMNAWGIFVGGGVSF